MSSIYEVVATASKGGGVSLSEYAGKVLLIVNVASECGLTPQYEGLEKLYRAYSDAGLRVLAFPSNEFGGQEPGTDEEINRFCRTTYDVTFDLFAKTETNGEGAHPLYQQLTAFADDPGPVEWNFEKFVIDRAGRLIARFRSRVKPDDEQLVKTIEQALRS